MDEEPGRDILGDDDPDLARFFAGDDLSADPVPDGGKPGVCEDCDG